MKVLLNKLSYIGVLPTDCENTVSKKTALTMLPFYTLIPALVWAFIYLLLDNFEAFLVPMFYVVASLLSIFALYKTKNFVIFEIIQLLLILFLPFLLMWILGGFSGGSFVMIWAFYAPVAAIMYSQDIKSGFLWFVLFLVLVITSMLINSEVSRVVTNPLPQLVYELFVTLNVGAGLGGIFFLISQFIKNIKEMSKALEEDKEVLYELTNDLKNANKELEQLATCDIVTELPNRLYFQDIVYDMFVRAKINNKIVAIMFLDLDGFKSINDTLGHDAGDEILKMIASRLKATVRDADTVARVGGDEFAIAIGNITDVEHVKIIAQTIIKDVNEYCPYNDQRCHVGVSIGISFYPEHGNNIEELMKRADQAMYEIKKMGKNNYSIYHEETSAIGSSV